MDLKYKHSGDFGDIIFFLPVMKFRPGHLFIQASKFTRQPLTPEVFKNIAPLLEAQSYVKSVQEYKFEQDLSCHPSLEAPYMVDGDFWRRSYYNQCTLAEAQLRQLKVPLNILDEPWLSVNEKKIAPQIICRTPRYHGRFPIEIVGKDAVFIGMPVEYEDFCKEFKKIPYYETQNLLEAAEVIAGAELFIGNQGGCLAVCMGLKQNVALEVWSPTRGQYLKNGIVDGNNIEYYYVE